MAYICWGQRSVYVKRMANGLGLSLNVTVRTHEDALDNDTFASGSNIPKDCHVQSNFIDCEKERFNPVVCLVLLFWLQTSTRMTLHWRSRRHSAVQSDRAFSWQRPSVGLSVTTNMWCLSSLYSVVNITISVWHVCQTFHVFSLRHHSSHTSSSTGDCQSKISCWCLSDDTDQEGKKITIDKAGKLNIYIAMDISDSIEEDQFNKARNAVKKLITKVCHESLTKYVM